MIEELAQTLTVGSMNTAVRSKVRPSAAIEDERLAGIAQNRDLTLFPDRRRPHSANGSDRHVERPRQFGQLIDGFRWCSEEDLVIVAARRDRRDVPGVSREDRTYGGRERHPGSLDDRGEFRGVAEVPQVSEQAIRDIKCGACNPDQPRTEPDARLRQAIATDEKECGVRI